MKSILAEHPAIDLLRRIEGVGISRLHRRARLVMGTATFFDAFDVLTIAYVMPVLIGVWHLAPEQIGLLISASFIGQIFGAVFFGWLAERIGRLPSAAIAIGIMSVLGIACGFAWDFQSLLIFRVLQGVGIGGEVPVAAAYINELCGAHKRGRFFLFYEGIFAVGLVATAAVGSVLVPLYGWRVMFFLGAIPGLAIVALLRTLPESPRWLIGKGRLEQAETVVRAIEASGALRAGNANANANVIENPLPPPASPTDKKGRWTELFSPVYRTRTFVVWGLWICVYFVNYGLNTWMPTVYRSVYGFSVAESLRAGLLTNAMSLIAVVLCATLIDRLGRKIWFLMGFVMAGIPLIVLGLGFTQNVTAVIVLTTLSFAFVTSNSMVLYLYTPEIYPTRIRAVATGVASSMLRVASALGPIVVGFLLHSHGIHAVFVLFAVISAIGALCAMRAIETRERVLEELAP